MRMLLTLASAAMLLALGAAACDDDNGPQPERFTATLAGGEEVPAVTTPASGSADVAINPDGTISYTLNVSNINQVIMAHIHGPAPRGQNAGIIVWLFPPGSNTPGNPSGPLTGQLSAGTLTATNTAAVSLDSLASLIRSGQAYVNVHTSDGVAGPSSGPGDNPGGEIRGQLVKR